MKKIYFFCLLLFFAFDVSSQANEQMNPSDTSQYPYWIEMMQNQSISFYKTQRAFNLYWANRPIKKGQGWKQFKRWEAYWQTRVDANGNFPSPAQNLLAFNQTQIQGFANNGLSASGAWTQLGPTALPANGTGQPNGLGRVNCVAFHPSNANIIYIGAPAGGLWRSYNGGASWTNLTDNLPSLGVSSIIIDSLNPSTIYIGTGDRDAGDSPGIGVYKSTNGGLSWAASNTGMGNLTVGMMLIHPSNHNILLAATSGGIYKSINAGASWTLVSSNTSNYKDLKFNPGNPAIVYAVINNAFFRSTNTGDSWTQVSSGLPTTSRFVIGVSPANANYVYIIAGSGTGFTGAYLSTNSGQSFTAKGSSPNILGYAANGSDNSSQAWYDLCVAVDRTNANILYVGGINVWKSTNGGTSWAINAHWVGTSAPAVHADQHWLGFNPINSRLYLGCDGGVYFTTNGGSAWNDISSGLAIAQVYRIGQSASNKNLVINGYQDNGTAIYKHGNWSTEIGGDGFECIIDPTDTNFMYGALYFGDINRSNNNGTYFSPIAANGTNGITEDGAWVTPYTLNVTNPNIMYIGYKNVWRSTNVKTNNVSNIGWTKISTFGNTSKINMLENSPADQNILYASRGASFFRSDNVNSALPTWTTLTAPGTISDIEAHPTNPNIVYITAGTNIYKSTNKGSSWTSIKGNLPTVSMNTIVFDTSSNEGIYVGTDIGVFYINATMSNWVTFSVGLPASASVSELEIYYGAISSQSKLRAATFGRGLWSSDLYSPPNAPPVADFSSPLTSPCQGGASVFNDLSTNGPTSWHWSFSPATISYVGGTNANSQNPIVQFNATGNYSVTLIAINQYGSDTLTKINYIIVGSSYTAPNVENFETFTVGNPGTFLHDWTFSNSGAFNWRVNSGTTPTTATGPNSDHTTGTSSGKYLYTEASAPAVAGEEARLISPCINIPTGTNYQLAFWYHMYGSNITGLHVDIFSNGNWINNVWTISGQQQTSSASAWLKATSSLATYAGSTIRVRFRVIRGASYNGDVAVDDISIESAISIPVVNFIASTTSTLTGVPVSFADMTLNSPNTWNWIFSPATVSYQNGTNNNTQNPQIIFNAAGQYSVSLIATNAYGSDTLTKTNYITVASGNSLPFSENFETFTVGTPGSLNNSWSSTATGGFNWTVNSGSTPSAYTGPNVDHTLGTSVGKYMFTEASAGASGSEAQLVTPFLNFTSVANAELKFWYHMYGAGISALNVDVFYSGNWTNVYTITGQQQSVQTLPWLQAIVNLQAYAGYTIKLRFRVISSGDYRNDIAIDDIFVQQITPPANDNPCGATTLTVGTSCNYTTSTNANSTSTTGITNPLCGGYNGNDVWFKAVVPTSGYMTIDADTVPGYFHDGAMAAYSGSCSNLTYINCNDDYLGSGNMPHLSLSGLTSGDTIFIRFWKFNGNGTGSFKLCVTEPPYLNITPTSKNVSAALGSTTFQIITNQSWTVADNAGWVTESPSYGAGSSALTVNYSANAGAPRNATITVYSTGLPNVTAVLSQASNVVAGITTSSQYLCKNSTSTFTNTSLNNTTNLWYVDGVYASSTTNLTYIFTTIGSHIIKLKVSNGINSDSTTSMVYVSSSPLANAGTDISICEGNNISLNAIISYGTKQCNSSCSMPTYCVSHSNNDGYEYIHQVSINGSINTSENEGVGYQDNSLNLFTILNKDSSYNIAVTGKIPGTTPYLEYVDAYIDWNRNGLFDEPSISMGSYNFSGTHVYSGIVTVPSNAVLGKTKMRVILKYASQIVSGCDNAYSYGETEDYQVEIVAIDTAHFTWTGPNSYNATGYNPVINNIPLTNNGTYTLSVSDDFGCSSTDTKNITVYAKPNITFSAIPSVCVTASAFNLTQASPVGGTYFGANVINGSFNPATAGAGIHTVYYTFTNASGCSDTASQTITVNALPTVSFSGLPSILCAGSPNITLVGSPLGGTFSGTGMSGSVFNPSIAGTGIHSITYSYTNANNCSNSVSHSVSIQALPQVNAGTDINVNYSLTAQLAGTVTGSGTYTHHWTPANKVVNASALSTQTISMTSSQIFTLTATETTNGCSDSDNVTVTVIGGALTLNLSVSNNSICLGDSVILHAVAGGGTGNYSYSWYFGGNLFSNNSSPLAIPTTSGYYKIVLSDVNTTKVDSIYVTVNSLPSVSFSSIMPICEGSTNFALYGGLPSGGIYSGAGVVAGQFYPIAAGIGNHQIKYSFTDANGCINSATKVLTVNANPIASLSNFSSVCNSTPAFSLTGGSPAGGFYSGIGVVSNSFNPVANGVGTYIIKYIYIDANSCSDTATANIVVNSSPVANAGNDQTISYNSAANLSSSASGGSGSYSYLWSPSTFVINANVAATSTTNLLISKIFNVKVTDNQTLCIDSDKVLINVSGGSLTLALSSTSTAICYGDSINLTALASGGTGNYSYTWTSNPNGFTSSVYSPIFHPIANTKFYLSVSDGINTLIDSILVTVSPLPSVNLGADALLCGNQNLTLNAGSGFASYLWSNGATSQTINILGLNLSPGTHTYSVVVTNAGNCKATDIINIVKGNSLYLNLGLDDSICSTSSKVLDAGFGFHNYLWSTGDTTQLITVSGANVGVGIHKIYVDVSSIYGCKASDTIKLKVYLCQSISELSDNYDIKVFPNPSSGKFTIHIESAISKNIDYDIINIQGQIIKKGSIKFTAPLMDYNLNIPNLAKGVYFIRMKNANLLRFEKIVIQ